MEYHIIEKRAIFRLDYFFIYLLTKPYGAVTIYTVMKPKMTPMLKQYHEIKAKYKDAILFFRMGDFYEMFYEDAKKAARVLEIALTSRNKNKDDGVPMCGVPVHAAENYLTRLVQAGYRVAVCEQVEDPKEAKGLVKREVVRVVTPGLMTSEGSLGSKSHNFIASLSYSEEQKLWGFAYLDILTGLFKVTQLDKKEDLLSEIFRIEPSELLLPESFKQSEIITQLNPVLSASFLSYRPDYWFKQEQAEKILKEHFSVLSLQGYGLSGWGPAITAAGSLIKYVQETQKGDLGHINKISPYEIREFLKIDESTKRNLELVASSLDNKKYGSLLWVLDKTKTPMGGRLLKQWILFPLLDKKKIYLRLEAVNTLKNEPILKESITTFLKEIYDIERLNGRIVLKTANSRDLLALSQSLKIIPELKQTLLSIKSESAYLNDIFSRLDPVEEVSQKIDSAIDPSSPVDLKSGGVIKKGYNKELDELIDIQQNGKQFIASIQEKERNRTGISTLRVRYNKVFGYFIEVSKGQTSKVPEDYIRKQTLVNAERYITPELKEIESKVLSAQERRIELESQLFKQILSEISGYGQRIKATAEALAELDVLNSLAIAAEENNYVMPQIDQTNKIEIFSGRHPVIEKTLEQEGFVPNDILIGGEHGLLMIITGPNMAGKSTVLRQTALIVLMAQIGSFVPAEKAKIGIVDQIFTRIGATDYLSRGQSTFMVEMSETANILHNSTSKSLVILDEIGRGTSTYDGLAIAWSVAEFLLKKDKKGVKTLFATHYHELTKLAESNEKAKNYHVKVEEWGDEVVFVRKLAEGPANKSYGIQVAALAGVPDEVIKNAKKILEKLESKEKDPLQKGFMDTDLNSCYITQPTLPIVEETRNNIVNELKKLDIDNITPIEALNFLAELKAKAC